MRQGQYLTTTWIHGDTMTPPISDNLQALSAAASKLNKVMDDLNKALERIEGDILRTGVGVTVWLNVDLLGSGVPPDQSVDYWQLGFTKIQNRWRIAVRRMETTRDRSDPETQSWRQARPALPLASAPRQVRLKAPPHLEALIEELTDTANRLLERVESAKRSLTWTEDAQ